MTTNNTKGKGLYGKAFFTEYGLGDHVLSGWEAKPLEENEYQIKRINGTKLTVKVGQELPNVGRVDLDKNNNLSVGKYTVIAGEELLTGWTAKKTRKKNEFMFRNEKGRRTRAAFGDTLQGIGMIHGLDDYGNIKIGDGSVPIEVKQRELKLLIYKDKHPDFKHGFKCHFNVLEPGSSKNHTDGAPGVFFPAKGKAPAKFCEVDSSKNTLSTAIFWPSKDKSFSVGKIRSIQAARTEKALHERVKALEKEAEEFEINPEDNIEYVQAQEQLKKANNDDWQNYSFTITSGHEGFGLMVPENSYSNVYSR